MHAIARFDTVSGGCTAVQLQYVADRLTGGDGRQRKRRRMAGDPGDGAILPDEDHVERDKRVLHPHGHIARLSEVEEHAVVFVHAVAVHQPGCPAFRRVGNFHRDAMRAAAGEQGRRGPDGAGGEDEIGDDRKNKNEGAGDQPVTAPFGNCLLYTSPSPRD